MTRVHIKPAVKGLYPHDYNPFTAISIDYGELVPTRYIECYPRDNFHNVEGHGLCHIAPQSFPPFGKLYIKQAAFFVPEHQIIEYSEAFHSGENSYKGKAIAYPWFRSHYINYILADFLNTSYNFSYQVGYSDDPTDSSTVPALNTFDFSYVLDNNGSSRYYYYKLTRQGRRIYKILKSLGYDFASFGYSSTASTALNSGIRHLPAGVLLAYVKIYTDMFLNGQDYNRSRIVAMLHAIRNNESYSENGVIFFDSTTSEITKEGFYTLLTCVRIPHEQSLYTEALDAPNSPEGLPFSSTGQSINPSGLVSPQFRNTLDNNNNETFIRGLNSNPSALTAFGLRTLKAFDSFVRRYNLAGSKAVQKIYAQFGIKSDDYNSHFVHKLFENSQRVKFYPVLSQSDTANASSQYPGKSLGSYAGYGQADLNISFNYDCNDFGFIISVAWLNVAPIMLRGTDPMNLRQHFLDWWTAQFDGQTVRAIPKCEVSTNKVGNDDLTLLGNGDNQVYGFCNIYDELRHMRDIVAGDFIDDLAKNFLFARDLSVLRQAAHIPLTPQDDTVHYWDPDSNPDMTDPFQMSKSLGDRFWFFLDWDIKSNRPMLSGSESANLGGSGELDMPVNGNIMQ